MTAAVAGNNGIRRTGQRHSREASYVNAAGTPAASGTVATAGTTTINYYIRYSRVDSSRYTYRNITDVNSRNETRNSKDGSNSRDANNSTSIRRGANSCRDARNIMNANTS
jgi:hypothetical protein